MNDRLHTRLRLAPPDVDVEQRPDGSMILRSPQALAPHARRVGDWLCRWAREAPQRTFLAERRCGDWFHLSYAEALDLVRRVGQGLLNRGLNAHTPLMVLSGNSIEHAMLAFGAMHVGVPYAAVSPAYSLLSQDHAKLRQIHELLQPGAVYASDPSKFAAAFTSLGAQPTAFQALTAVAGGHDVDRAFEAVAPDSVAKILFTSGSTGSPKGVVNTQRMLTSNQQQSLQAWPFLGDEPPVVVDWLPWNHTFGGNYNLHMVLSNGGTMYIDDGKPVPGHIETTVRNLKDIAPTTYFNVPLGFELLLPHLENDRELRRTFFSRCSFMFYAGAALPQHIWERLQALALAERGGDLALVSSWGSTETAPQCCAVHFPVDRSGVIGLPVPACELKLVPFAGKLEARVRGPHVTPGYYRRPDLTAAAFDDEGFYRMGDALRFVDPARPQQGLAFDGRVAEDFKLRSGTWVHVGALRLQLIENLAPLVQNAVITGHGRDEVGALLFLSAAGAALTEPELQAQLGHGLARLAARGEGSSARVGRVRVTHEPLSADGGEITDKGYINQRAVLERRSAEVERLHADPIDPATIRPTPASLESAA